MTKTIAGQGWRQGRVCGEGLTVTDITINIDDYVSDDEKRQIAREAFRAACAKRSRDDFERELSNAAYALVQKEVDAAFDGEMVEIVKSNAVKVINSLSSYTVFKRPDVWDRQPGKGWEALQGAIEQARPTINARVLSVIERIDEDELRDRVNEIIGEIIVAKLTSPAKETA